MNLMVDRLSLALAPPLPDAHGHHISYFFWFFAQASLALSYSCDDSVALPLEAASASP